MAAGPLLHAAGGDGRLSCPPASRGARGTLLIAPDAFKGTLTAHEVAGAIGEGARAARTDLAPELCPVADGGEGSLEVLLQALGGWTAEVPVHDPLGRVIEAELGWAEDGRLAIVEVARASGLGLLEPRELDAEGASSEGTGEMIAQAAAAGARRILVAAGGSASSDGGAGAIAAIEAWRGIGDAELVVLADVETPFELAAEVYAPQKGAGPEEVTRLSERLRGLASKLPRDPTGLPMTGAAGGLAGGLWARYGARLVSGAEWVLDAVGFDARLARALAVVTGEGRLDAQTLAGKAVARIARRAGRAGVPVHAVVGSSTLPPTAAAEVGLASVREARDEAELIEAGRALAFELAPAA